MIVLDTATWIWRASDPKRLTTNARRAIDEAERSLVSAISVWEVAMLVAKRRIQPRERGADHHAGREDPLVSPRPVRLVNGLVRRRGADVIRSARTR